MIRLLSFLGAGSLFSVAFFTGLSFLVNQGDGYISPKDGRAPISMVSVRREKAVTKKERRFEPPPPKMVEMDPLPTIASDSVQNMPSAPFETPKFSFSGIQGTGALVAGSFIAKPMVLRGLTPVAYFPPEYPYRAQSAGIEGAVEVEFTIDENGAVTDIKVIKATPPNYFERAAKRAIARWKFHPQMEKGVAVRRRASQVITFKLKH